MANNRNEAINKWKDVGNALVVYTEKNDEKTLGECIEIIFGAIKFVSPYASTVFSFVKPMLIPDPMMLELNRINEKLFDINRKLDKIVKEIKEHLKLSEYNTYLNKLHNMQTQYTRFIQTPNTISLDDLNKQSDRNEMFEFANWLHREVMGQSLNPLIDFMKADDDYPKFIKWTQLILSNYAQSMLLHGISVQLRANVSKEIKNQTMENDTNIFQKNLREMSNLFTKFIEYLKQNYLTKLEERTINKVKTIHSLHNQEMANEMYDYVSIQYPFREWFVFVANAYSSIIGNYVSLFNDSDKDQVIFLIECEKDGNRLAMSFKEFYKIYCQQSRKKDFDRFL